MTSDSKETEYFTARLAWVGLLYCAFDYHLACDLQYGVYNSEAIYVLGLAGRSETATPNKELDWQNTF